jgi:hypothetical protein
MNKSKATPSQPSEPAVDVRGLNRDVLFNRLWLAAHPAKFPSGALMPTIPWMIKDAKNQMSGFLIEHDYADFIYGRCMKVLGIYHYNQIDPTKYNRFNGEGLFQKVVEEIRDEQEKMATESDHGDTQVTPVAVPAPTHTFEVPPFEPFTRAQDIVKS